VYLLLGILGKGQILPLFSQTSKLHKTPIYSDIQQPYFLGMTGQKLMPLLNISLLTQTKFKESHYVRENWR
jgi:hypothetical protein